MNRICDIDRKAFQTVKRGGEVRAADLGHEEAESLRRWRILEQLEAPSQNHVDVLDKIPAGRLHTFLPARAG